LYLYTEYDKIYEISTSPGAIGKTESAAKGERAFFR
jgi:hypothetical protein